MRSDIFLSFIFISKCNTSQKKKKKSTFLKHPSEWQWCTLISDSRSHALQVNIAPVWRHTYLCPWMRCLWTVCWEAAAQKCSGKRKSNLNKQVAPNVSSAVMTWKKKKEKKEGGQTHNEREGGGRLPPSLPSLPRAARRDCQKVLTSATFFRGVDLKKKKKKREGKEKKKKKSMGDNQLLASSAGIDCACNSFFTSFCMNSAAEV